MAPSLAPRLRLEPRPTPTGDVEARRVARRHRAGHGGQLVDAAVVPEDVVRFCRVVRLMFATLAS